MIIYSKKGTKIITKISAEFKRVKKANTIDD